MQEPGYDSGRKTWFSSEPLSLLLRKGCNSMHMDVFTAATAALDGAAYKIWEPRYLTKFASGKAAPPQKLHCSLAVRSSQGSLLVLYPEGPSTQ